MENEQSSQVVQAPGMEINQGEHITLGWILRIHSENRKPDNAVLNAATEQSSLANFLPAQD